MSNVNDQLSNVRSSEPSEERLAFPLRDIVYYTGFPRLIHDFWVHTYALLPRLPLSSSCKQDWTVRLACLIHAASVHPELGSNSYIKSVIKSKAIDAASPQARKNLAKDEIRPTATARCAAARARIKLPSKALEIPIPKLPTRNSK